MPPPPPRPRCCVPWTCGADTGNSSSNTVNRRGLYRPKSSNENLTFHKSCSSGFHYKRWPRANTEMGLAWVQNDYKTKWIPNIWKNEEKGEVTRKALAQAASRAPLRLPRQLGAGGPQGSGPHTLQSRRGKKRDQLRQTQTRKLWEIQQKRPGRPDQCYV